MDLLILLTPTCDSHTDVQCLVVTTYTRCSDDMFSACGCYLLSGYYIYIADVQMICSVVTISSGVGTVAAVAALAATLFRHTSDEATRVVPWEPR